MDSLITAAARALRAGDPLGALKRIALRDDPDALALRGIAMAQLGELARARRLLRRAARAFGARESLARARCVAAEAEVALAGRDLAWPGAELGAALRTFTEHGDDENRIHAGILEVRRLLLLGHVEEAGQALARVDPRGASAMLAALAALLAFEIAVRRGRTAPAEAALARAGEAAAQSGIPPLIAEVERAGRLLSLPAARLRQGGEERLLRLAEVEAVLAAPGLVVDACRRLCRSGPSLVTLARRPVLFALLRALGEAWPAAADREALITRAFGARRANASHRARLRVEMGRLRRELRPIAGVRAEGPGFVLVPRSAGAVRVLVPPVESAGAAVSALLADGEAWSTSALALALGASQRTVQRLLGALERAGEVQALGAGRARRWLSAPVSAFATTLLLPLRPGPG
jgi:hypothetical protein